MDKEELVCMCVYIYMYVYIYIYMYTYIHIHIYVYMMKYFSVMKASESCHLQNMDRPWGYYAKWDKTDKGKYYRYDITYVKSEKLKLTRAESWMVTTRAGRWGKVMMFLKEYKHHYSEEKINSGELMYHSSLMLVKWCNASSNAN